MSDRRQRCPICECVMHRGRHYGSERTCLLVLSLKDRIAKLEAGLGKVKQ